MSFYPLFNILDNKGFLSLPNFPPNNWELDSSKDQFIHIIRRNKDSWEDKNLGEIKAGNFSDFSVEDFSKDYFKQSKTNDTITSELVLLELRSDILEGRFSELVKKTEALTSWPDWRATVGFSSDDYKVSYQGEINPFPPQGSLLTFHPFVQLEAEANNFFIFVNIEKNPKLRWVDIDIFLSQSKKKVATHKIRNNCANIIPLDSYVFEPNDLPVFSCQNMTGIPFGFAKGTKSSMMSLEHTHPPGSFSLYGNRHLVQKKIKSSWIKDLYLKIQC
jgi:hypothetical protein